MNFFTKITIILIGGISFIEPSTIPKPPKCTSVPGKCLGNMEKITQAIITRKPVQEYKLRHSCACQLNCTYTPLCVMAEYEITKNNCRIFDVIDYQKTTGYTGNNVFLWKCCYLPAKCTRVHGRCTGLWIRYPNVMHTTPHGPIGISDEKDDAACFQRCLSSPWKRGCALVNFRRSRPPNITGNCVLFFEWPRITTTVIHGWDGFKWMCCNNSDTDDTTCHTNTHFKCSGYWKRDLHLTSPNKTAAYSASFYTLSSKDCRDECKRQSLCFKPWYSKTLSFCQLESDKSTCTQQCPKCNTFTWETWTWVCCKRSRYTTSVDDSTAMSHYVPEETMPCLCITNKTGVSLVQDNCSMPTFKQKREVLKGMAFLKLGQNIEQKSRLWRQVSTGYDNLWLHYTNNAKTVEECPPLNCIVFSGSVETGHRLIFINRSVWFARPSVNPLDKFPRQMRNIVLISNTQLYPCGCYSLGSCSDYLRGCQYIDQTTYNDIQSHFYIGSDGGVYKGVGWKFMSPRKKLENREESYIITFIGLYDHQAPPVKSLKSALALIKYGIKKGHISSKYELWGLRDVTDHASDTSDLLYAIIHNWPRYKGMESKKDCGNKPIGQTWIVALCGVLSAFIFIAIFLAGFRLYRTEMFHGVNCRGLRRIYQYHRHQNGGIRVRLIPLAMDDENEGWNDVDILHVGDPDHLKVSLQNTEVYILRHKGKSSCACCGHLKRLAQYARGAHSPVFIAMANHFARLTKCHQKTCLLLLRPMEPLAMVYIIVCHLDDVEEIHRTADALRSNDCLCSEFHLSRVEPGFEAEEDQFMRQFTSYIGPGTSKNRASDYLKERRRFIRTRRAKGSRFIMYPDHQQENLVFHIGNVVDL